MGLKVTFAYLVKNKFFFLKNNNKNLFVVLDVCPPQPANLVPVELAGNYRTCSPYARLGTPQSCPENSACLYTGTDNGFICCRVQLSNNGLVLIR